MDTTDPEHRSAALPSELFRGYSVGRYVVSHRLGAGGMGVVYCAYDPQLARRVALKFFHLEMHSAKLQQASPTNEIAPSKPVIDMQAAQAMLLAEARAAAKVADPHVVSTYDVGTHAGQLYMAMEYIEGQTLRCLGRDHRPSQAECLRWLRQGALGLAAVHRTGLVHADFKPENVMITREGQAKVLDFGLAHQMDWGAAKVGKIQGTLPFLAPELLHGAVPSVSTDIFAWGVTAYETLCRRRPFSPTNLEDLRRLHANAQWAHEPRYKALPGWIRALIGRALHVTPLARYANFGEIEACFVQHLDARTSSARWVTGAMVATLCATLIGVTSLTNTNDMRLCEIPINFDRGNWNQSVRQQVADAFQRSGSSLAQEMFERLDERIQAWNAGWVATFRDACETAAVAARYPDRVHANRTPLYDQQVECLNQRLARLQTLANGLAQADKRTIERSLTAVDRLGDPRECKTPLANDRTILLPDDPVLRANVEDLVTTLMQAEVWITLGDDKRAGALIDQVQAEAQRLGWTPLYARLINTMALRAQAGWAQQATYNLGLTGYLVHLALNDTPRAAAGMRVAIIAGTYVAPSHDQQNELTQSMHALARRAPDNDDLQVDAYTSFGASRMNLDDGAGGALWYTRADTKLREMGALRSRRGAIVLANRGHARVMLGDAHGGELDNRTALRVIESLYGHHHPELGPPLYNLAFALTAQNRPRESLTYSERGRTIMERLDGQRSPRLIPFLDYRAEALSSLMRWRDAMQDYPLLVELIVSTFGAHVDRSLRMRLRQAEALWMLGEHQACRREVAAVTSDLTRQVATTERSEAIALAVLCGEERGIVAPASRQALAQALAHPPSQGFSHPLALAALWLALHDRDFTKIREALARAEKIEASLLDYNPVRGRLLLAQSHLQLNALEQASHHLARALEVEQTRCGGAYCSPQSAGLAIELAQRRGDSEQAFLTAQGAWHALASTLDQHDPQAIEHWLGLALNAARAKDMSTAEVNAWRQERARISQRPRA